MSKQDILKDAVLRVGEVSEVNGRRVSVLVDKNKNLPDLFLEGEILRNISVSSYIEIRKGFLSIIGHVDGEKVVFDTSLNSESQTPTNVNKRVLSISLLGHVNQVGNFVGGTKELPLIGNEAFVVTSEIISNIHSMVAADDMSISIATLFGNDFTLQFPVDGLFNSHIAIFGNTGSGKSNTLASLYDGLVSCMMSRNATKFKESSRFILFDFNGEYSSTSCISDQKTVLNLSTRDSTGDKIPLGSIALMDVEILSIISSATEKTQKPFIKRSLALRDWVKDNGQENFRSFIRNRIKEILLFRDVKIGHELLDIAREIFQGEEVYSEDELTDDITWLNNSSQFAPKSNNDSRGYFDREGSLIDQTKLYQKVSSFTLSESPISQLITFLYLQLIKDVTSNRAQYEHISPLINRIKGLQKEIDKVFDLTYTDDFWQDKFFVVVNLLNVNLQMRKTIPLILSKMLYANHKEIGSEKTLTIIIDEAHNVLSKDSVREVESWKDYRLETFEEIIKEGRKFGVFLTISSQRPNDISPTITSQAHNYFIHRLVNERDLNSVASSVSYIDKLSEESIPSLPVGTCIFSGVVNQMPLKIKVKLLSADKQPRSQTRTYAETIPPMEQAIISEEV